MKLLALRSVSALGLAALLAACGAGEIDQPTMTTAAVMTSSSAQMSAQMSAQVPAQVSAAMPAPDCAADGCKSLRVIDGNAEAYRFDAMRRAAAEQAAGTTNS